jgi:hypothetical protein
MKPGVQNNFAEMIDQFCSDVLPAGNRFPCLRQATLRAMREGTGYLRLPSQHILHSLVNTVSN